MFKALKRAWRYFAAALTGKLEDLADPKIQIEQAIQEAKKQHQLLSEQAAAVLGNRRELEIKLGRKMEEVEKLQASARQALVLSEKAAKGNDSAEATKYEQTAQAFATKLVAEESAMTDLKALHDAALESANAARKAVDQNAYGLQQKLAERSKLLSQLEHTKMQERMNEALKSVSELSVGTDVPTLNEVRDKIEGRYARALGTRELAADSVEVRMLEVEKAAIDSEGSKRLEELRASLSLPEETEKPATEKS